MIKVENLIHDYGAFRALDGLSFSVGEGEIFGLVGPNGAGKTTCIDILSTILSPTQGDAWVAGHHVLNNARDVKKCVGHMPDFYGLYDEMKVWEFLHFFGLAYDIVSLKERIEETLNIVELSDKHDAFISSLSRGMRQKLCIARALLHDPKVIILDEPLSGLDPSARQNAKKLFLELKSRGKTLLVSSHILPEMDDICDRFGILQKGKMVSSGSPREIAKTLSGKKTQIVLKAEPDEHVRAAFLECGVSDVKQEGIRYHIVIDEDAENKVLHALVQKGAHVFSYNEEPVIEDLYLQLSKEWGEKPS